MGTDIHRLVEELYTDRPVLMKLWGVQGGQEDSSDTIGMAKMASHSSDRNPSKKANKPSNSVADVLSGNKRWMQYTTWHDLYEDIDAYTEYLSDCNIIKSTYDLDFSEVTKTLSPYVLEKREYGGLIGAVDGKLRVIYIEKSPTDMSEEGSASVPSDIVAKISRRPALFFFHTHPSISYNSMPSPEDIIGGIASDVNRKYVAELIVSTSGITMYKPSDWLSRKLNDMYVFYSKVRFDAAFTNYMLDFIRCSGYNFGGTRYYDDDIIISQLKQVGVDVVVYQRPRYYKEHMRDKSIDIISLNRPSLLYNPRGLYTSYRESKKGRDAWIDIEIKTASATAQKIVKDEGEPVAKSYMFI